jgi:hypothetical protein
MEIQTYKFDVDMWFISIDEYPQISGKLDAGLQLQSARTLIWYNTEPEQLDNEPETL